MATSSLYPSPFDMPDFRELWWRHLAAKFNVQAHYHNLIIRRKRLLPGLSLKEARLAGWNAAWFQAFTENDLETLANSIPFDDWDYFRVSCRRLQNNRHFLQKLNLLGFTPIFLPETPGYQIDLSEGFDAYLQTLSRSKRKDIRRNLKAIEPLNPELRRVEGEAAIEAFLETFFKLHIDYWKQKSGFAYFNDPRERAFILAWAKSLDAKGQLLAEGFYLDNTLTNLTMNIVIEHTLYSLITINTGDYLEYAPGLTSLYHRIRHAKEYDIRRIAMGGGTYDYKASIANTEVPQATLIFANPSSVLGKLYVWRRSW